MENLSTFQKKVIALVSGINGNCPFMDCMYSECYINNLCSLNIEKIINHCGGQHEGCPVYREKVAKALKGITSG